MADNDSVRITNRDIYDLLQAHVATSTAKAEEIDSRLTQHVLDDASKFSRLNVKFYGILVSLLLFVGGTFSGHVKVVG
jgi:hypothetical protein